MQDYYSDKNVYLLISAKSNLSKVIEYSSLKSDSSIELLLSYWIAKKRYDKLDDFFVTQDKDEQSKIITFHKFYYLIEKENFQEAWEYFVSIKQKLDGRDNSLLIKLFVKLLDDFIKNNNHDLVQEIFTYVLKETFSSHSRSFIEEKIFHLYFKYQEFEYITKFLNEKPKKNQKYLLNILDFYYKNQKNDLLEFCKFALKLKLNETSIKYITNLELSYLFEQKNKKAIITLLDELSSRRLSDSNQESFYLLAAEYFINTLDYNNSIKYLEGILKSKSKDVRDQANYFLVKSLYNQEKYSSVIKYVEKYSSLTKENTKYSELEFFYVKALLSDSQKALKTIGRLHTILKERTYFNIKALELLNNFLENKTSFIDVRIEVLSLIVSHSINDKKYIYALYERSILYFLIGERQRAYEDVSLYIKQAKDDVDIEIVKLYELQFLEGKEREQRCRDLMRSQDLKVRLLAFEQLLLWLDIKNNEKTENILSFFSNGLYGIDIHLKWLDFVEKAYYSGDFSDKEIKRLTKITNHFFKLNQNLIANLTDYQKYLLTFCQFYHSEEWQGENLLMQLKKSYYTVSIDKLFKLSFLMAKIYEKQSLIKNMIKAYEYVYFSPFSTHEVRQKVLQKIAIKISGNNQDRLAVSIQNGYSSVARKIYEELYYRGVLQKNNYIPFKIAECFFIEGKYREGLTFLYKQDIENLLQVDENFHYYYLINFAYLKTFQYDKFKYFIVNLEKVSKNAEQKLLLQKLTIKYWQSIGNYKNAYEIFNKLFKLSSLSKEELSLLVIKKSNLLKEELEYKKAYDFLRKNSKLFEGNSFVIAHIDKALLREKLSIESPKLNLPKLDYVFSDFQSYAKLMNRLEEIKDIQLRLHLLDQFTKENNSVFKNDLLIKKIVWLDSIGNLDQVIQNSQKLIKQSSNYSQIRQVYFLLSKAYYRKKQYKNAIENIDKILKIAASKNKYIVENLILKAKILSHDKWKEKIKILKLADEYSSSKEEQIKIATIRANATYHYANLNNDRNTYSEANKYYLELTLLDEKDYSYIRIICALKSKEYNTIHQLLSGKIFSKEKEFLKGLTYYEQGNYENAKSNFLEIIDKIPDSKIALHSFYFLNNIVATKQHDQESFDRLHKIFFTKLINYRIFRENRKKLVHCIAYSFWSLQDYKTAYKYWQRFKGISDEEIEFWVAYSSLFIKSYNIESVNIKLHNYSLKYKGELADVAKLHSASYNIKKGNYQDAITQLKNLTPQGIHEKERLLSTNFLYAYLSHYQGQFMQGKKALDFIVSHGEFNNLDYHLYSLYHDVTLSWINEAISLKKVELELKKYSQLMNGKNDFFALYGKIRIYNLMVSTTQGKEKEQWQKKYLETLSIIIDSKQGKLSWINQYYYCRAGYDLIDFYFLRGELKMCKLICLKLTSSKYQWSYKAKEYLLSLNI